MATLPEQQNTVEVGTFSSGQSRFEVAINFPQGARVVRTKGGDAGKSYLVAIEFSVKIQYSDDPPTTWTELPPIKFIGIRKDAFILKQIYFGTTPENVLITDITRCFNSSKSFKLQIARETKQALTEEIMDVVEEAEENRYYYVSILQSVTGFKNNTKPATDPLNTVLAKTALSIKATRQLNGQVEGINALAQTYAFDWNNTAGEWQMANTSNPASLFRYVLTHPANPQRIKDNEISSKIDLQKLQYWHNYCNQTRTININGATKSFKFEHNSVVSAPRSLLEVLRDICAAGRASPTLVDGKWSVNIDEPKSIVQHFTPHNSWGFEGVKSLPRIPDGLKIKFYNEEKDYQEDELIIYNYGKSETNAELLESITLPGVTNSAQVADHGMWHFAQIKLRPEIYTLNTDMEYLICNRGDRVKVTHDVPMWGIGSGRIKNRIKNAVANNSTNITTTSLELDEEVYIDSDNNKNYTLRIRTSTGTSITSTLVKQFPVSSWSYSGNTITMIMSSTDHPLIEGESITVPVTGVTYSVPITSVSGTTITCLANGLSGIGSGTGGTAKRVSGNYSRIQVSAIQVDSGNGVQNPVQTTLNYSDAQPLDLFLFGELNKESADLIVLSIEPTTGVKNARLTLVDYGIVEGSGGYNIFTDYKNLTSITYDNRITAINPNFENLLGIYTPQVPDSATPVNGVTTSTRIVSDFRAMELISPGVYSYNILVPFTAPEGLPSSAEYVEAEYYPVNSSHVITTHVPAVPASSATIKIGDVQEGRAYKLRLRYVTTNGIVGIWGPWYQHVVVGKLTGPEDVKGFGLIEKETGIEFVWEASTTPDYKSSIIKKYVKSNNGLIVTNPQVPLTEAQLTEIEAAWDNEDTPVLFEGNAKTWTWLQAPDGFYNFLIKHKDVHGNYSKKASIISIEYYQQSFATFVRFKGTTAIEKSLTKTKNTIAICADLVNGSTNTVDRTNLRYRWYDISGDNAVEITTSVLNYDKKYAITDTLSDANPQEATSLGSGVKPPLPANTVPNSTNSYYYNNLGVGSGNTLTISEDAVTEIGTFRVDIIDTKLIPQKIYSGTITVYDTSDPYDLVLISSTGDKLPNSIGQTDIKPQLFNGLTEITNFDGYTFTWRFQDKNGKRAGFVDKNNIFYNSGLGRVITSNTSTEINFSPAVPGTLTGSYNMVKIVKNGEAYYHDITSVTTSKVVLKSGDSGNDYVPPTDYVSSTDYPLPVTNAYQGGVLYLCTLNGTITTPTTVATPGTVTADECKITVTDADIDTKGIIICEVSSPT